MFDYERENGMPLRQLGWAFLLAWVFCVFYTNAVGAIDGRMGDDASPLWALYYGGLPLAASVLTLIAIVVAEPHIGSPTSHRGLVIAAPVLTAASTPLMFFSPPDPTLAALLFAVGSCATGMGSALLWVMWGAYYAVIPRERAELLAPVSAVSAALLVLLVSAMGGWVAVAVAASFPLLSGWCFHLVWTADAARTEQRLGRPCGATGTPRQPLAGLGRTGAGILVVFAIVSIAGMTYPHWVEGPLLQAILVFSALMMALVAVMAISGPRRMSMFFLYRWMCPTLVIGFAALILGGGAGAPMAVAASLGGRFTFCLIAQIYFANYAAAGRATPAQASSLGWLFVHAGDLVGVVVWAIAAPYLTALPDGLTVASVLCIVVLVVATMLVMGETSTFLRVPAIGTANDSAIGRKREEGPSATEAETEAAADANAEPHSPASDSAAPAPSEEADALPTPSAEQRIDQLATAHSLTPREIEVFALLAQGRSIPYIRDELIISRETAATHAKHIYAKLGVHSRQELIDLVQR